METTDATVRLTKRDDVGYILMDSPPYNILTCDMMDGIGDALDEILADTTLKAVAVSATGKAFSAGADVGEHSPDQAPRLIASFGRMFRLLHNLELPVVMAVHGPALGGGFELALMADVLLAGEGATFGQPEIRLGFFAPVGVAHLSALVGPARAMEITCSGRVYPAAEMKEYGLVSRVVPDEGLEAALEATLKDFRRASPRIMRMNVRMVKGLRGMAFPEALDQAERVFLEELMATEDVKEGIASFFEKRRPVWKNR